MFDLDHIFVMFAQGSGGNFVTAVMRKIQTGDLTLLDVNRYGSYHILDKRHTKDSIAFGAVTEENDRFSSIEEKEKYYLAEIKKEYTTPRQVITWSHDFTNLPLYKKYFPKSRTLTITAYTPEEKLMSIMMQVNKVFLADEKYVPISKELWGWFKDRLSYHIGSQLKEIFGPDIDTDKIFENRMSDEYIDLFFYLSVRLLLVYGNLSDVFKIIDEKPPNLKYHDSISIQKGFEDQKQLIVYRDFNPKNPRINYLKLISENSDALLPLNHLPEKDFKVFKKAYSDTLNRNLTLPEEIFLEESFEDYYNRQDDFLLDNPVDYFKYRKLKAFSNINLPLVKSFA